MEKTFRVYDMHTRRLVSTMQAFIAHHRHPDGYNCPNLDEATTVWERANDFNVETHAERGQVYYGLWSAEHALWMTGGHDNLVIHSASLPLIKATCQAANKLAIVTDWQVKIIGDDGLPVDLPRD